MKIKSLDWKVPVLILAGGFVILAVLIALKDSNTISMSFLYGYCIIFAIVLGITVYSKNKETSAETIFGKKYKHIGARQAGSILKKALNEIYPVGVKSINLFGNRYLSKGQDQVSMMLVVLNDNTRFTATVPLDRGADAIYNLDFPMHPDRAPVYSEVEAKAFAKESRKDIENVLPALPTELRPMAIAKSIENNSGEVKEAKDGED